MSRLAFQFARLFSTHRSLFGLFGWLALVGVGWRWLALAHPWPGIGTSKGQLVSSILYPAPMRFKYDEELPAVLLILAVACVFIFWLATYLQVHRFEVIPTPISPLYPYCSLRVHACTLLVLSSAEYSVECREAIGSNLKRARLD